MGQMLMKLLFFSSDILVKDSAYILWPLHQTHVLGSKAKKKIDNRFSFGVFACTKKCLDIP